MSVRLRGRAGVLAAAVGALTLLVPPGVAAANSTATASATPRFTEADLVSDIPGLATLTDPLLVNPWGLALGPTTPLWSANNGTNTATLYAGATTTTPVTKVPLEVPIPGGAPTGQAFNDTTDFVVTGSGGSAPARFLFVSEGGDLTAWNPTATPNGAVVVAHVDTAIYKGLALVKTKFGPFLLAADFHNNRIDVFNSSFHRINLPPAFFRDRTLPAGYAPFNVFAAGDSVYVSYAKQDADAEDEVAGPGKGFVDQYLAFGLAHRRVASRGTLNAPWGMAFAPSSFGKFGGDLLVGNFGDGRISVFERHTNRFEGLLRDQDGIPISIDGLWALLPGTATTGGTDGVWFSAGLDDESHGLVGIIRRG